MAEIARFEDIAAWQHGRELARLIYRLSSDGGLARDFALRDQMRRSVVSVISNIAEGFERGGTIEFRQFLSQAKGSVGELRAQLYVALDAGLITQAQFDQAYQLATSTARLIAGFMRYLGSTRIAGVKFKASTEDSTGDGAAPTGESSNLKPQI